MPSSSEHESLELPPPRDAALLAVALAGVASSGPLIAATVAPALAIAFWRNAFGAAATGAYSLLTRRAEWRSLDRRSWVVACVAGAFLALHFATWVPSVTMTSVASATALVATQPVFAAIIAHLRGRRLPRRAWLGIGVALVAIVLLTGIDVSVSARAVTGDLLALIGGACAALYVSAGSTARTRMSATVYISICYTTCSVLLLVACVVGAQPLHGFSGNAWLKIVAITVAAQLLGHSLFNLVLRSTSPTVLSLALLFEVPGAAIIAYFWLHQHPPGTALVGLVVLMAGLAVVVSTRTRADPVDVTE